MLVKVKIKIKDFYDTFSTESRDNEVVNIKKQCFIKNEMGELSEIIGVIRKSNNDIYKYKFTKNKHIRCSDGHILKTEDNYKKLKDITMKDNIDVFNDDPIKLISKKFIKNSYVYDIALKEDSSHAYLTPNGLINHNTTIARILTSKNGILANPNENLLFINGSSKSTRGIKFVDEVIEPFLKIPPAGKDKQKVVLIDEADGLTSDAIDSLRGVINKYSSYGRFIFTCNYVSKISDPLMSRFSAATYEFKTVPVESVIEHCKKILVKEEITFDEKDLAHICKTLYPDTRKIIGVLQKHSKTGQLEVDRNAVLNNEKFIISSVVEMITSLNNKQQKTGVILGGIVKALEDQDVDYRNIYSELFSRKEIPANCKIVINRYANTHSDCFIPHMHFMSMCFDIGKTIQDYIKLTEGK